jgi:hypothetical protein
VTENTSAIQVQTQGETQALSRWDALAAEIAIATEESQSKAFDYEDKSGNKEARSWAFSLRKLKTKVEQARKDAKAVHLERGRRVDDAAKLLQSAVQSLIEPHENEIKAIEAREQARIDAHRAVLDRIASLSDGVTTADEAQARLVELSAIDIEGLEEFSKAGANRRLETAEMLKSIWDRLVIEEAERAELEALRAEKAKLEKELERQQIREEVLAEHGVLPAVQAPVVQISRKPVSAEGGQRKSPKDLLVGALIIKMSGKTVSEIAHLIASDRLHPAVSVDLSKVKPAENDEVDW